MILIKYPSIFRQQLSEVFDVVTVVNVLDSRDNVNLALLTRPDLGVTFTKLHCWRLTQFSKCVFLDADTLVSTLMFLKFIFSRYARVQGYYRPPTK